MHDERFNSAHQAKVVEWIADKGYGWLSWNGRRLFIHQRGFVSGRGVPKRGDRIEFVLGSDAQGRTCAVEAVNLDAANGAWLQALIVLPLLLALPVYALHRAGFEVWMIGIVFTVPSTLTYMAYASDKRRARSGVWRISEATLHLFELFGGWPGAWLAQRLVRHKCSKTTYQMTFWGIVFLHQFIAADSLDGCKGTKNLLSELKVQVVRIFDRVAHDSVQSSRGQSPDQGRQRIHPSDTNDRFDDFR